MSPPRPLFPLLFLFLQTLVLTAAPTQEIWAYLMKGEEHLFPTHSPITDVACFSAQVTPDGTLKGGHSSPPPLPTLQPLRYHLVVTTPWNPDLLHLYLNPDLPLRERIIREIVNRAKPFDGVQIDFEGIRSADGTAFLNFLATLKKRLPPGKTLSVAVMARWEAYKKRNPQDAYDYAFIGLIADRVIVMAYDEHYGGGTPGPIASLSWCEKIQKYAQKNIPPKKLVMGIPLYGRSWQLPPTLARTCKNREIIQELKKKNMSPEENDNGGYFNYTQSVSIQVHYETEESIQNKIDLYTREPLIGLAFWRIGQEPEGFWEKLKQNPGSEK